MAGYSFSKLNPLLIFPRIGEMGRRINHRGPLICRVKEIEKIITTLLIKMNLELLVASARGMRSSDVGMTLMMIKTWKMKAKILNVIIVRK